jgi:hypothetical protein
MPSPIGMAAPAQKPNWYTSETLPKEEFPSIDWAASIVPTKNSGRLLPAIMNLLLLFFTSLEVSVPTVSESARNARIAMPYPSNPAMKRFIYLVSI